MARNAVAIVLALVLTGAVVPPALAADLCPEPEPEFGEHIASMAPEHPPGLGRVFGEMISTMASGE